MAVNPIKDYLRLIPAIISSPSHIIWLTFDKEADVLYINFKNPSIATDSELTDDDVIIRYDGDEIIGYTILNATKRNSIFETPTESH